MMSCRHRVSRMNVWKKRSSSEKSSEYDLAQKRLQITAGEQRQIRKALNRLRSKYLAAGRYSDGIDKIIIQVAKPNTTRHMFW
mgnify:CR=1 FL=1